MVEITLVAPILILLVAAVMDFGRVMYQRIELTGAARTGADYAMSRTDPLADAALIEQVVRNALGGAGDVAVTTSQACQCPGGSSVACSGNCGATAPRAYLTVAAQRPLDMLFIADVSINAQATMRTQ